MERFDKIVEVLCRELAGLNSSRLMKALPAWFASNEATDLAVSAELMVVGLGCEHSLAGKLPCIQH